MRLFGREPAYWLSLVAALIIGFSTFVLPLTADQQGGLNAIAVAAVGLLTAVSVHDGALAAAVGLFKALIALGLSFGLHLTPDQQFVLMMIVQTVGAGFVRSQVTPVGAPPPAATALPVRVVGRT